MIFGRQFSFAAAQASLVLVGMISSAHGFESRTVFVATVPYKPTIANAAVPIDLGDKARSFDFGGDVPFINPKTGVVDLATINVWDVLNSRASVLTSSQIGAGGVAGRVFKTDGYTAIGYVHGDGIVEGKLRTQANSYPIPARRRFMWDLVFRLGGATLASPWTFAARNVAPATLWQLKTEGLPPALVMAFDTDPDDSGMLTLSFDQRLDPAQHATNLVRVGRLAPLTDIIVRIEAFLDERTVAQNGKGFLRIAVNDKLVFDRWGQNLQQVATRPYHWSLGMYLFSNTEPLPFDRFVYWKNARQLTYD